jgi:BirA family biotin operon repressor/biotin-[acetyl-CoA-carboxylase] ligase
MHVFDGTIVITADQTAGRGQRGNTWEALPGQNITCSIILKPEFLNATEQFKLNIAISLGIYDFLSKYLPENLKIKWPNDIYIGDRKIGGVLIENTLSGNRIAYSIIGIGLNINQLSFEDAHSRAISLRLATQNIDEFDIRNLIEELCVSIEKYYFQLKNGLHSEQKKAYLEILYRYQEKHFFRKNEEKFLGKIVGVAPTGHLMIEANDKVEYFDFKEVSFF